MNKILIRPSVLADIDRIMPVYESAKAFMRRNGNFAQWTGGYPGVEVVLRDIESGNHYIGTDEFGEIVVVFAFIVGEDPTYSYIEDGKWLNDEPYGTIHRIASSGRQSDTLSRVLDYCFGWVGNIRIDTHIHNAPMLQALERNGFMRCGVIYIADGTPRTAFQKAQERVRIVSARPTDAPYIGSAVTMAIGDELARSLAGPAHTSSDVEQLFTTLAARTDSQYSFRNALVALDEGDRVAGVAVSYDGARLHELRRAFISEAESKIGLRFDASMGDETDSTEFYVDTLAVFPEYRGRGIARRLLLAATDLAKRAGKPLGLLVDKNNGNAARLYRAVGFRRVGERPFAGEVMDHLIKES